MNDKTRWMCSTMGNLDLFHGHCMMVKLNFAAKGLLFFFGGAPFLRQTNTHRINGAAIYMVTFTINIPQMLAYIPEPWILWDMELQASS